MPFQLTSPAFTDGETMPRKYTGDGLNVSPPLAWTDPPARTESFALFCEDPDALSGTWDHWLLFDIPGNVRQLSEHVVNQPSLPGVGKQGKNSWNQLGYGGPTPPPGKLHHYVFVLMALSCETGLLPGTRKNALLRAIEPHVVARAELTGTYGRSVKWMTEENDE